MEISLSSRQSQTQHLALSPQMLQSLHVLNLDIIDLYGYIAEEVEKNPVLVLPRSWEPSACGVGLLEDVTRADGPTLLDELRFQLHTSDASCEEVRLGEYVIDCIDDRGFLTESREALAEQLRAPVRDIARVVGRIQSFEPEGVGAADLQECLAIQLRALGRDTPCVMALLENSLQDLARNRLGEIARRTGFPVAEIREALRLIQSLDLYPGRNYDSSPDGAVVPEILYAVENGILTTRLCNELPPLCIDDPYEEEIADDEEAKRYIHHAIARAQSLVTCIGQRNATLLKCAECVARDQRRFFLEHAAPVPLNMKTVAEELGLNVSTVSRTLGNRYFEFDRRVYPFKDLFHTKLKSGESDAVVRAEIRRLIDCEDKRAPLSDQAIAERMRSRGIEIARRTIAKYRIELGIESTGIRRLAPDEPDE